MKEMLEVIVRSLVEDLDSVSIKEIVAEKTIIYEIKVASNEMGKIIGREGKIASAIRNIAQAVGNKNKKRVSIEFID